MCGIAGIIGLQRDLSSNESLERMCGSLEHRGPDDHGYKKYARVHLGMRRLAIIDLAGGSQPLFNESGTICVVFNGEIYNFRELRGLLEAKGHHIATQTDGAVIAHLYEEY